MRPGYALSWQQHNLAVGLLGMEPARVKGLERLAPRLPRATEDKQHVSGLESQLGGSESHQVRL